MTKSKAAGTDKARQTLGVKVDPAIKARIEAVRVSLQKEAPPGMVIRVSDAARAALERGLETFERAPKGKGRTESGEVRA